MDERAPQARPRRRIVIRSLIILVVLAGFAIWQVGLPSGPVGRAEVEQLEAEHAANPDDLETALELALTYMHAGRNVGLMGQAMDHARAGREAINGPKDGLDEMDAAYERMLQSRGFESREQHTAMVERGIAHTESLLDHPELSQDQRIMALLVHGELLLVVDESEAALAAAREAAELNDAFPGAHLLVSDAHMQLRQYDEAIEAAERAIERVDDWMDRPMSFKTRLLLAAQDAGDPAPGATQRRWERDRRRAADEMHDNIRLQIELAQTLRRAHSIQFD